MDRVSRNFWILVAATVLAVGGLSTALREPSGPVAGTVTAVSALAALVSMTLAGRILVVVGRRPGRKARNRGALR
ncbi:MAG TPA: hypothetical protein VFJ22_04120 [Dermatophilaceae bacterium]|jgi:hypothetical protein|nr:hypothetical protein [Dermatophilaceae bacterium]